MGGRAEGLASADPGARTPTGVNGTSFIKMIYTNIIYISGKLTKTSLVLVVFFLVGGDGSWDHYSGHSGWFYDGRT